MWKDFPSSENHQVSVLINCDDDTALFSLLSDRGAEYIPVLEEFYSGTDSRT